MEKDISKFLSELTHLASDLPMEFVSWRPEAVVSVLTTAEDKKDKKDKKVLDYSIMQAPISVVLRADYNSLVNFLKRIEEADRFIKIDTFIIEPDQRNIYKHNIKMKLGIFIKEER